MAGLTAAEVPLHSVHAVAGDEAVVAGMASTAQAGQQSQEHDPVQTKGSLHGRPTAKFFNEVMSCVVPLYLMMLGSVVFFASM
jgi:hypothetical protein